MGIRQDPKEGTHTRCRCLRCVVFMPVTRCGQVIFINAWGVSVAQQGPRRRAPRPYMLCHVTVVANLHMHTTLSSQLNPRPFISSSPWHRDSLIHLATLKFEFSCTVKYFRDLWSTRVESSLKSDILVITFVLCCNWP